MTFGSEGRCAHIPRNLGLHLLLENLAVEATIRLSNDG